MPARSGEAGFTLIEALVALGVLLVMAMTLVPALGTARRLAGVVDRDVAPQALLRRLLDEPFERNAIAPGLREGRDGDLSWRIEVSAAPEGVLPVPETAIWRPVIVTIRIEGPSSPALTAQTLRLVGGPP